MKRYTDINTGNNLTDEALENYLMRGFEPGGFLTAVLANDLYMAVGRADHYNQANLVRIVKEVTFKMPSISWGSYAAVEDWCNNLAGCQSLYAEAKEKQRMMDILSGKHAVPVIDDAPPF
jgi:hypothetical protein